jgi:hypothetical protein
MRNYQLIIVCVIIAVLDVMLVVQAVTYKHALTPTEKIIVKIKNKDLQS